MNPELETRIEAYIFAEMSAEDRAQFETQMAQNADLRAVVAERQELAQLVRRAFIREKVREAQAESGAVDADVPLIVGRTVSMRPWRYAVAASFAVVLAAAAYFLWQQTEKLQQDIAMMDPVKENPPELVEKSAPVWVEKPTGAVEKPVADNPSPATGNPKTNGDLKILTDKPATNQPKIAEAPTDRSVVPKTYGIETRGLNQQGSNEKGETIYQNARQKADLSRFKGTGFESFIGLFDKRDFANAARLLSQMQVTPAQEDARELLLGIACLEMGDTNRSVEHLMNIYEPKNPYYFEGQWWLALAFCREGKMDSARDIFQKMSKTAGHPYRAQAENALRKF